MDEIITYKMCAVKVRNAKLRNYLKAVFHYAKFFDRTEISIVQIQKISD